MARGGEGISTGAVGSSCLIGVGEGLAEIIRNETVSANDTCCVCELAGGGVSGQWQDESTCAHRTVDDTELGAEVPGVVIGGGMSFAKYRVAMSSLLFALVFLHARVGATLGAVIQRGNL